MKQLRILLAGAAVALGLSAGAQDPWLHIQPTSGTLTSYDMTEVLDVTFDETTGTMTVNKADGTADDFFASAIKHFKLGGNVPEIRVVTSELVDEVYSKAIYLNGTLTLDTRGTAEDLEYPVKIRGRGNSTWNYTKKPYRLKFDSKQRVLLPKKAKNFVLLANYIDPSMMRNQVAFGFGKAINMPWIHHAYPVDFYFNDVYKGSYMLTEKVGFNNGSVNIKASAEPTSIMFEIDCYDADADEVAYDTQAYDTDNGYYLTAKIKDPDCPYQAEDSVKMWQQEWFDDLDQFMGVVATGDLSKIFEACDLESLVRYIMVFDLTCNQELNHPKSVYIYKTGGKYYFGPCWDFDWAFGYQPTYTAGSWWSTSPSYENPLIGPSRDGGYHNDGYAGNFFRALCNNDTFLNRFREVWNDFYANGREQFWAEFEAYADMLEPSAYKQGSFHMQSYTDFRTHVDELREWVENRIEFINTDEKMGLWNDSDFDGTGGWYAW